MKKSDIMVSVQCITYNHANYIRETLEGFLMQKTTFQFEILIHDDASTDGTVAILQEYEQRYPNMIRVLYEKENQWGKDLEYNHDILLPLARGKYIALCEGDDAWIDDSKLQRQVEYLESHPKCSLTFHKAFLQYPTGYVGKRMSRAMGYGKEGILNFEEIFSDWNAPTSSFLFRRDLYEREPEFFRKAPTGDEPLMYYMASEGEIYYFDRVMSVYNRLSEGSWTSVFSSIDTSIGQRQITHLSGYVNFLDTLNQYLEYSKKNDVTPFIKAKIIGMFNYIILAYDNHDDMLNIAQQFKNACPKEWWTYIDERIQGLCFWDSNYFNNRLKERIQGKRVYIYGAGVLGKKVANYLKKNNTDTRGYIVSNIASKGKQEMDMPVRCIDEINLEKEDYFIVISVTKDYVKQIEKELLRRNITEYIWPFAKLYDE